MGSKCKKAIIAAFVLALVFSGLYVHRRYSEEKQQIVKEAITTLKYAAMTVKYLLPDGFHTDLPDSIPVELDDQNIKRLTDYAKERDLQIVYSFVAKGTNVVYTASSIGTNFTKSRYGFICTEPSPTILRALGKAGFSMEEFDDHYAVYWTREEGDRKWAAGTEYKKDAFNSKLNRAVENALWDIFYAGTSVLLIAFAYIYSQQRKIDSLTQALTTSRQRTVTKMVRGE